MVFCVPGTSLAQAPGLLTNLPGIEPGTPILVQADEMIYNNETDEVTAIGNVQIFYDQYVLLADRVVYDRVADEMTAYGNVRFTQPDGNVVFAETLTVTGDFKDGFINSVSLLTAENARVAAQTAERIDGNIIVFNRAVYTACEARKEDPEKSPIWQIRAVRVVHNQEKQIIEYENATFEFLGIPIAYFPYFFHPDPTVKRKSGFLIPSAGHSSNLGASITTPYFLAVAPNADITISPTVYTDQGLLLRGEWRHRIENGQYSIYVAGIDQLDPDVFAAPGNTDMRGFFGSTGSFQLSPQWTFGWDGAFVTDDTFTRKYGVDNRVEIVSQANLTGQSERNYFDSRVMHFRDLIRVRDSETQPLIHPVIDYNLIFGQPVFGGELGLDANITSLTRDIGPDASRASVDVHWNRTFTDRFGQQITPFFSLRGDATQVNAVPDPITGLPRTQDSLTRGMATAGLEYRYPFISLHSWGYQIIEPIFQVLIRPDETNAGRISNEDALSLVFDDTTLFDHDKFSGFDRIEGGSRANVGVRYSLQTNSGMQARALVGQSYHLAGTNPFGAGTGLDSRQSDYVGGFYIEPNNNFGLYTQFRIDSNSYDINRNELGAWLRDKRGNARVAYMRVRDETGVGINREEIQGNATLVVLPEWHLFGSYRYDIAAEQQRSRSLGIRYICDCFNASLEATETFFTNQDITPDLTFMFRFHFKSLGGSQIGSSTLIANE
ncbi:MAG: LPS-assembly protein LptD [Fimbriimonadaceae bacterium]|nr:LPS-assembly protein LptD [Alphaproteobacteria bacterium]